MSNYTLKPKKETDKELAHTDVYKDGKYIGYLIIGFGFNVKIKWHWCGIDNDFFFDSTKKELLNKIKLAYDGRTYEEISKKLNLNKVK